MNVAVVAKTQEQAVEVAARLGMTRTSTPMHAGVSPLLGQRFTAVLIVAHPISLTEDGLAWWAELKDRTSGPTYTIDEWEM